MIREATNQDSAAIAAIYNHYILNTVVTFEESAISASSISDRIIRVRNQNLPWFVVEEGSQVVGYAYATKWNDRPAYRHTVGVTVYLSHQVVSKGLGTKLYEALFAELRDKGFHIAIGGITLPNPASVAIHEKFGMKKVGHFEEVGYKFGEWLDVGYWQVKLNA